MPTITTATIGSTFVPFGQSTAIDVQVSCDSACGNVDYRLDGGEWGTVALDGNGHFTAGTGTNWSPGLHNVVVKFQGNGTYVASTSNPVSFTISSSSTSTPPTGLYSYNISSYAANGNVLAYSDSVNGSWSNIGYDGVNPLVSATYNASGIPTQYLCWSYDSFGNRTGQTISTNPCDPSSPGPLQYNANNQLPSIGYDASGNVTNDGTNQYLYDAEGRVCAVQYPVYSGITAVIQYLYDAEGRRVAKGTTSAFNCDMSNFSETAGYVLGPTGEQMTEVDGGGNWVHTNVYVAGAPVATYDGQGLHFHLSDWLGTRRVQTDITGSTQEGIYQSLPFGEMVPDNHAFGLGATEHHFTGKERDSESGLDYFGAGYYASSMGRWMSPDWSSKAEPVAYVKLDNPQSLNLYGYVLNNPLSTTDPDGHVDWNALKKAIGQVVQSISVKVNAGLGLKESIGTKESHLSIGGSATAFVSVSKKGATTGSDLKLGAELETPITGKLGKGVTQETLSIKDGVHLSKPGETTTEPESGIGAMTNSKETFSVGDETAVGPALGIELDVNKSGFKEGVKNIVDAAKAPNPNDKTPQ